MNKLLASALIISSLISISAFAVSPPAPIQQQKNRSQAIININLVMYKLRIDTLSNLKLMLAFLTA